MTSCELLGIIYPILFEYLDSFTINNAVLSSNGFKFKPKCLLKRYWAKNERIYRLNKYKIATSQSAVSAVNTFEYEMIRINVTSPEQFLPFYLENAKFQQNIETKLLSYYVALKNECFSWNCDEVHYVDLDARMITVDLWDVMSWCSSVDTTTADGNIHYFHTHKPSIIECIAWNAKQFNDLNNTKALSNCRTLVSHNELVFGFPIRDVFVNVRDTLILPGLLSGGDIIKEWYCMECKVKNEKKVSFNQIFGCIDEAKIAFNEWNLYPQTESHHILLKQFTFVTWKGFDVPKKRNDVSDS
eukprot:378694_1